MLRCADGLVFAIVTCKGHDARADEVKPKDVIDRMASGEPCRAIPISSDALKACFKGKALERAHAIASLTPSVRAAIFGTSYGARKGEASMYSMGAKYTQIGSAIVDHCKAHNTHTPTCEECEARKSACDELRDDPLGVLIVAAREIDPDRQVLAALFARNGSLATRATLRARGRVST